MLKSLDLRKCHLWNKTKHLLFTWWFEWFSSWCRVVGLFISEFKVGRHSVDLLRCLRWSAARPRLVGGSCGFRFRENIARHPTRRFQDPKKSDFEIANLKQKKWKFVCFLSQYYNVVYFLRKYVTLSFDIFGKKLRF